MATVVAKILGDGKSTDTAFHLAVQKEPGFQILSTDWMPVDPSNGQPLLPYCVVEIPDEHISKFDANPDVYVLPTVFNLTKADKATIAAKLAEQNCNIDLSTVLDTQKLTEALNATIDAADTTQLTLETLNLMQV